MYDKGAVLGITEVMLPSEVESLLLPATDVVVELSRLDIASPKALSESGDIEIFAGFEFDIPGPGEPGEMVYEIEPVGGNPDVQWGDRHSGEDDRFVRPRAVP